MMRPAEIEETSFAIISSELSERGIAIPGREAHIVKRVIHATADFDFAGTLRFTEDAAERGAALFQRGGAAIVTDTNMAKAGISTRAMESLHAEAHCFMADPAIREEAEREGITRAAACMNYSAKHFPNAVLAVGNAPTALLRIADLIEDGLRPPLVVAVPVGFVNVVESKERILDSCQRFSIPAIVAMGRKGGSTVCAAICNALLYAASGLLDPAARNG